MSVGRDAARTLVLQAGALGVGFFSNVLIARTLGPEGKGLLSFLAYVIFVLMNLAGLGLQSAAVQLLGKRIEPPERIAATQIVLSLVTWLPSLPLLWLAVPAFGGKLGVPASFLLPLGGVTLLVLLQQNLLGVLIGLSRLTLVNLLQIVSPIAWFGALLGLTLAGNRDRIAAAWVWMAVQAVGPLLLLWWVVRFLRPRWSGFRACARVLLRFGLEAHAATLLWILLLRADAFLLGYWSGAAVLGVYSVAVMLAELLWYLPRALTLALSPRVSSRDPLEGRRLTERAARLGLGTGLLAAGLLVALAPLLIHFAFGDAFRGALPPLLTLLPGILCGTVASPISLYFTQQRGRPRISAGASGLGLFLNLALLTWWVPGHGALGAAAASSCAYAVVAVLLVARFTREPGFSWRTLLLVQRSDWELARDLARPRRASADAAGGPSLGTGA